MNAIVDIGFANVLREEFAACRRDTLDLLEGLSDADLAWGTAADTHPGVRLALTSRYFELHVLARFAKRHLPSEALSFSPAAASLDHLLRHRRGVDARVDELLAEPLTLPAEMALQRALRHEQQQQELILVDLLSGFARNPQRPVHALCRRAPRPAVALARAPGSAWVAYAGGRVAIGRDDEWFAPDEEQPRHELHLRPFALAARPVSNRDWCEFIDDGGYARRALWSAPGWQCVRAGAWQAPLYWRGGLERPTQVTLAGELPLDMEAPVCHISAFEADAFARWARKRLPSEAQWEAAASGQAVAGNFCASHMLRPMASHCDAQAPLRQLYGNVWEWTSSAFARYPIRAAVAAASSAADALAGTTCAPSVVLRGGSCATPFGSIGASTRHALAPAERRHFSGLRLAEER